MSKLSEICTKQQKIIKKMHLKLLFAQCQPLCSGLNVFKIQMQVSYFIMEHRYNEGCNAPW